MTPIRVLLTDDEVPFLTALARRLTKRGFEAAMASSGAEALAFLAQSGGTEVDVVVLDVRMPGMDGLETLEHIRREYPLVEVIMLTGHATVESAIEGLKRGAYDFLMKPSDLDTLDRKIREAAKIRRDQEQRILAAHAQRAVLVKGN
jgi:DNA-binding NtrC family response regulator